MSRTILLDSGPLGLVTNPRGSNMATACGQWLQDAATAGATVVVPEIADYEVRRELIRARRTAGIARLDALISHVEYLAITTPRCVARQKFGPRPANEAVRPQRTLPSMAMSFWPGRPQP